MKPTLRPNNPCFSSGPCAKRPGWNVSVLENALLGRSHRSKPGKAALQEVIEKTRALLNIPQEYLIGIMPASDTGAYEAAMWTMLGAKGIDVFHWESFGSGWLTDIEKQLKLKDVRVFSAPYGELPDMQQAASDRDIIFCWNGTTSGVCVPNADWIDDKRTGLTFCDATSAAFAYDLPWHKLDVTTFSWQKVLGGEAQHGMLILSPNAVARLESYTPTWPLPKIFRLTKKGKVDTSIFEGATINTPSMLCVEDILDALRWVENIGGLPALIQRSTANLAAVEKWVETSSWAGFLATEKAIRSRTSICLKAVDSWFIGQPADVQASLMKKVASLLEAEKIAFDIGAYRDAPAGVRLWGGATVESSDMAALLPWLDWAYGEAKNTIAKAA